MADHKVALNSSLDEFVRATAKDEQKPMAVVIRDAIWEYKRNREEKALKIAGLKTALEI